MKKILYLGLGLSSMVAFAESPTHCLSLNDDTERLACFDKVHGFQSENNAKQQIDLVESYRGSVSAERPVVVLTNGNKSEPQDALSPLSRLYDLDKNNDKGVLSVREHEPMYLMPMQYNSSPNYYPHSPARGSAVEEAQSRQKRLEAKMQMSFKTKLLEDVFSTRADLWFGYTQTSNWQVYSQGSRSAPFRNTDYAPELFLTQPVKADLPAEGQLRMLGVGVIHQSNGRSRPFSRSWNRVYAMAGMEWGKLTVVPRVWLRLDPKGGEDDNPDIMKYMGYGDLRLNYNIDSKHSVNGLLRYNPIRNRGAIQVGYTFPLRGKLKVYVQGFHGYGENLIDYNHKQTSIGVGLMFNEWDKR